MSALVLNEHDTELLCALLDKSNDPIVAAGLRASQREPDLYQLVWESGQQSSWRTMPVEKLKSSHGKPQILYAYIA